MTIRRASELGRFLTVAEVAEILAVDVTVVDSLIRSGELPAIRVGQPSGPLRVETTQLDLWVEGQYAETRSSVGFEQGEFANVFELSGADAPARRLRAVD
ncbi:helix-turn-helix domain-containing protein [Agromyces sp. MMS24-JH15]|uniref:helix-turn-helix domain-containing protein n=1 Tax=Agromyces sp. MMS24-JH15 TaxID=3243765 RepID=UPI00374A7C5A